MAAARAVDGVEIVAVDAMQVYRGMDIGTAKPNLAERAAVPHHGLDLVDSSQEMAVADFRRVYDAAQVEIAARGHRSLVVAGTGMYLTAVLDRLEPPGTWPEVRRRLDADARGVLQPAQVEDALVGDQAAVPLVEHRVVLAEPGGDVVGGQHRDLSRET